MARTSRPAPAAEESPAVVEIIVYGQARQHSYGLHSRGRDYLYHTDPDGIVRVPTGPEAELFLHYVEGSVAV